MEVLVGQEHDHLYYCFHCCHTELWPFRIYFSDRLYSDEEVPPEFRLFLPVKQET